MEPGKCRILVVDDEAYVRRVLLRQLERAGFEAEGADGITEALRLLVQQSFDVVLLDMCLTDGSAETVLDALDGKPGRPAVILMSGAFSPGDEVHLHNRMVAAVLAKPFCGDSLRGAIETALPLRRPEAEPPRLVAMT